MRIKSGIIGVAAVLMMLTASSAWAQCKSFSKKKCLPTLSPYIYNGQLNSAILFQGENAELLMTFYSGQDYRLIVCNHDVLEGTYFEVKDTDGNLIYSSMEHETNIWDFNVRSTQQFKINVIIPKPDALSDLLASGCISVMVGFKD
ncbi:MAG: hypothetical protein ACE5DN_02960 [Flavobacteriales bacterium]